MFREVSGDIQWGNDVLKEKKKEEEEDIHSNRANITELPIFSLPDPGFFQNTITDHEIFDLINLLELSDTELDLPSTEPNIFLIWKPQKSFRIVLLPEKISDLTAINFTQYFATNILVE